MILASHELLKHNPKPTDEEIRHGLEGNMCRCTGYQNIVRAVREAAAAMAGRVTMSTQNFRLGDPAPRRSAADHRDRDCTPTT